MGQLHTLALEADERQQHAYAPASAERKDVWRPDIDVATAVNARVAADSEPRIAELAAELEEVCAIVVADSSMPRTTPRERESRKSNARLHRGRTRPRQRWR